MFKIQLRRRALDVLLAKDDGQIVGVMGICEWPHCQMSTMETLRLFPSMLRALWGTLPRAAKLSSIWGENDPKLHHWHLGPIGILPERQGQGIGSRLLRHFIEHVDRLGAAAYLETGKTENVRLYERFGFSVTGGAPVLDVPTWFMWRPEKTNG
jgi:ribosomal protein S18 acetylase RimI-like enzyme